MAILYSSEMYPPAELTKRINNELVALRTRWGDSVPEAYTPFRFPWLGPGRLEVWLDDTTMRSVLDGRNHAWDSLGAELGLSHSDRFGHWNCLFLTFEGNRSLVRLAEKYVGFPGLHSVYTQSAIFPFGPRMVRSEEGRRVEYYVIVECLHEGFFTYYYFLFDGDKPKYVGAHSEFICEYERYSHLEDSLGLQEFYSYLDSFRESLEAERPAWVDSARAHSESYSEDHYFSWKRDSL